jgi:hypothetical protein
MKGMGRAGAYTMTAPSRGTGGVRGGENSLWNPTYTSPARRFMLWVMSDKIY